MVGAVQFLSISSLSQCTLRVLRKVSAGGANLSAAAIVWGGHIDSGTLGGSALLHRWVRSQLALAASCGQPPQSIGIDVTASLRGRNGNGISARY